MTGFDPDSVAETGAVRFGSGLAERHFLSPFCIQVPIQKMKCRK
jgi:hypothetical protein